MTDKTLKEVIGDPRLLDGLPKYVKSQLWASAPEAGASAPLAFRRTIADDGVVLEGMTQELGRRLPPCKPGRIVVFAERDSLYSQALEAQLRAAWRQREDVLCNASGAQLPPTRFQQVYFFRGIDGMTTDDVGGKDSAARPDRRASGPIEWPESRNQLDYLRRTVTQLEESESTFPVRRTHIQDPTVKTRPRNQILAFGIFGQDVHDKLLILQALRQRFSDRLIFTTDMDARYVHPDTEKFTRNLVVVSSLPLEFSNPRVQAGTPPLRDVYQMAAFLAARLSVTPEIAGVEDAIRDPSVYEIGRSQAVPLDGYDLIKDHRDNPAQSKLRMVISLVLFSCVAGALFAWPGAPSMRRVRDAMWPVGGPSGEEALAWPSVLMAALELAAFVFIAASAGEYVRRTGDFSLATVIVAVSCGLALMVALQWNRDAGQPGAGSGDKRARIVCWIAGAAILGGLAWAVWPPLAQGVCPDCEPVAGWTEGVSAWPSHLIHLVTLFLILWALDEGICGARDLDADDAKWLGSSVVKLRESGDLQKQEATQRGWFARFLRMVHRPANDETVHFGELWTRYSMACRGPALVLWILVLWVASVGILALLYNVVFEGELSEMPIRGAAHRQLISGTLYVVLILWPLLVIMVARTTLLATQFIRDLDRRRTRYPDDVVTHFATGLGSIQWSLWTQRFAEDPRGRGTPGPQLQHTLMDDWLDVLVVERRTRWVARQVLMPFVILALILLASSRLFDAWPMNQPFLLAVSFFFVVLSGLTLLLNQSAENLRRSALARMRKDLLWMEGSDEEYKPLVEPFKRLIEQVQGCRGGAFASFFDQPLLRAALVPVGSFGGAKLLDHILMGR